MATIAIIGDGPAGLSAALFLSRGGHDVVVHGQDGTPMHHALLRNYLGIDEITGTDFQHRSRAQVERFGAQLVDARVTGIARNGSGLTVTAEDDDGTRESTVDYVVLAASKQGSSLARGLGMEVDADGVDVDTEYRTSVDGVYAVGRVARPGRSQAVISAGAGAVAALDILAREAGEDVVDWDSPDD